MGGNLIILVEEEPNQDEGRVLNTQTKAGNWPNFIKTEQ